MATVPPLRGAVPAGGAPVPPRASVLTGVRKVLGRRAWGLGRLRGPLLPAALQPPAERAQGNAAVIAAGAPWGRGGTQHQRRNSFSSETGSSPFALSGVHGSTTGPVELPSYPGQAFMGLLFTLLGLSSLHWFTPCGPFPNSPWALTVLPGYSLLDAFLTLFIFLRFDV